MLDSISWGEFLKGLGAVLVFYYGYVIVRYYRDGFKGILEWLKATGRNGYLWDDKPDGDSLLTEQVEEWAEKIDLEILPACRSDEELMARLRSTVGECDIPRSPVLRRLLASHVLLSSRSLSFTLAEGDIMDLFQLR